MTWLVGIVRLSEKWLVGIGFLDDAVGKVYLLDFKNSGGDRTARESETFEREWKFSYGLKIRLIDRLAVSFLLDSIFSCS